ncbi:hypothetical protein ElyMa_004629700 [Elysia marginata]|uniref:Uncharacterized protein n=1 Tax=Elysia marginata TaxID=1093978 RepID=A0AAV4HZF1_9GAST|nr:hypothetical protein ElyMa_004629700 [Elysia marginata]
MRAQHPQGVRRKDEKWRQNEDHSRDITCPSASQTKTAHEISTTIRNISNNNKNTNTATTNSNYNNNTNNNSNDTNNSTNNNTIPNTTTTNSNIHNDTSKTARKPTMSQQLST